MPHLSSIPLEHSTPPAHPGPLCTFVSGPRDSGKTRHILEHLRRTVATSHTPEGTVAVLLAEAGRTRAETLSAAFPGLILRRLFLPCQCCPELARLPAALRATKEANPRLEQVFIEVPDIAALRFLDEFDAVVGWPRNVVLCLSAAWAKARRLDMLLPFQSALIERADTIIEHEGNPLAQQLLRTDNSPTTAPFDLTLPR
ncbi:hypothetical protein M2103_000788 [Ereboglobus sp. PH5-5]|uniref:hypothetical protein n=1 Tax=unclassified Ereboglobus TaxID=2626932 RepID=UPI0024075BC0|nr:MULTISPECIES: hypothetical protein [unclassified Ereboglobus]MDF9827160.1 hypothetical protein [Ereboglobus sp. PH5-10]MDF9832578.1 hypothetical protein [Ereboglobus sp. PH5-5]